MSQVRFFRQLKFFKNVQKRNGIYPNSLQKKLAPSFDILRWRTPALMSKALRKVALRGKTEGRGNFACRQAFTEQFFCTVHSQIREMLHYSMPRVL